MKIEFIGYPYVYTDEGTRHHIKEIQGTPRVGAQLDKDLNILNKTVDEDCVSGACPIR